MLVTLYGSTSFGHGEGGSVGEVALLPRDCGRDESKKVDEELVLNDGIRSLDGVPGFDETAGSIMSGLVVWFSTAIALNFNVESKTRNSKQEDGRHTVGAVRRFRLNAIEHLP